MIGTGTSSSADKKLEEALTPMSSNLFADGEWTFVSQDRNTTAEGKGYYPAMLSLRLKRQEMIELIARLADTLMSPNAEYGDFPLFGTIKREKPKAREAPAS